jgi:hypothetical protein
VSDWRHDLRARYPDQVRCTPICADGWRPIIESAVDLIVAAAPMARIVEMKEKFGTLRIYCETPPAVTAAVDRIVAAAEEQSGRTCEICGNAGVLYDVADWLATRCVAHAHLRPGAL